MTRAILIIVFFLISLLLSGQKSLDYSVELQAYPTGLIPGVKLDKTIGDQSSVLFRLGYNWFRHRDLGVHDDERGGGFGGTLGYRRYFKNGHRGWSVALKNDIWWNKVDWSDIGPLDTVTGETSITVLQPTMELGFTILKNSSLIITPTFAFGFEWNVRTKGAPTGEGAIILAGISIGKRLTSE